MRRQNGSKLPSYFFHFTQIFQSFLVQQSFKPNFVKDPSFGTRLDQATGRTRTEVRSHTTFLNIFLNLVHYAPPQWKQVSPFFLVLCSFFKAFSNNKVSGPILLKIPLLDQNWTKQLGGPELRSNTLPF